MNKCECYSCYLEQENTRLKAEITELQDQVGRLSANYLLVLSEGNEEIAMLKAVTEAFVAPTEKLQAIYDKEINIRMSWFWDGGVNAGIGDDTNGWKKENNFKTVSDAVDWLYSETVLALKDGEPEMNPYEKLRQENTVLLEELSQLKANCEYFAKHNSKLTRRIAVLEEVREAFASVASEEGVREMLLGYVQGAAALEALEGLRNEF